MVDHFCDCDTTTGCRCQQRGSCLACHRRDPVTGLVCDPCRDWLPLTLAGIETRWRQLPTALEPSTTPTERVSGSQDPPAPLNLDVADLLNNAPHQPADSTVDTMIPATTPVATTVPVAQFDPTTGTHRWIDLPVIEQRLVLTPDGRPVYCPAGDQIGYLPVAVVLDQWARDWATARQLGEHRPLPTVPHLIDWLTKRLPWACDHYDPVGDFAADLRRLRGWLMGVLGEFDPPPEHCDGVPCAGCDRMELFVVPDGSGDRECANPDCRRIYRPTEYGDWVKHLAAFEKGRRTPAEIRRLLHTPNRPPN